MKGSCYFMLVHLDRQDGGRQKVLKWEILAFCPHLVNIIKMGYSLEATPSLKNKFITANRVKNHRTTQIKSKYLIYI